MYLGKRVELFTSVVFFCSLTSNSNLRPQKDFLSLLLVPRLVLQPINVS